MDVEKTDSTKGTQSSTDTSVYGSQALMQNGTLVFKGNLFYKGGYTDGNTASGTAEGDSIIATALSASGNNNSFDSDPLLAVKGTAGGTGINAWSAHPTSGSPALSGASTLANTSFLTQTSYKGAFDGITDWTTWTKTTTDQYLATLTSDYDGDSLTLAQEISSSYNTNPTLIDTDGDGINDNLDPILAEDSGSIFFGLSTRAAIDTKAIVGGLTIEGTENMLVMVRVKGPSMNLKNGTKLPNPKLEILKLDEDTGTYSTLLESLDFGDHTSSISYADRATGDNLEPVVVESLAPGTYSMRVKEENSQTGNANLEIYGIEGDSSTSKMFGISTRGYVGDKPMVGGLNISGTESKKVLIRVKGPSMTLKNATLLPNPKITVLKLDDTTGTYSELVVSLDYGDHSSSSAYADRATGNNLEPMIVETLEPGTYSIKVQDETGQSGNANLEVYEVE